MLDIGANRKARKWSKRDQALRVLWALCYPLFRWSPRPFWAWRRLLLRSFGATVAPDVHVYPTVRIAFPWHLDLGKDVAIGDHVTLYALGTISVGKRATISSNAHICAGSHDYTKKSMPLLKPPISIGEDVWICADAFVGPGVNVGNRAVVGARAVVVKDIEVDAIVAGNPAGLIKKRPPIS